MPSDVRDRIETVVVRMVEAIAPSLSMQHSQATEFLGRCVSSFAVKATAGVVLYTVAAAALHWNAHRRAVSHRYANQQASVSQHDGPYTTPRASPLLMRPSSWGSALFAGEYASRIREEMRVALQAIPMISALLAPVECLLRQVRRDAVSDNRIELAARRLVSAALPATAATHINRTWSPAAVTALYHGAVVIPAFLLFTDFTVYWTHRLLHHPWLLRRTGHVKHHRVRHTTAFSSFVFHPVDAALQILPAYLFFVATQRSLPCHPAVAVGLLTLSNLWVVALHDVTDWGGGSVVCTSRCHTLHHEHYDVNFGLFTVVWDRLFGTWSG